MVFQILSSRQISRNQASLKFLSRKWSYITSTKRHIICHIFPVLRCNNFNFSSAMKSHNIIKKRNLLLICYFLFLKISSELWKRTREKRKHMFQFRKSDISGFADPFIILKNRNNFIHFPLHESLLASNKKSTRIWRIMFDRGRGISKPVSRVASRAQKPVKTTRYSYYGSITMAQYQQPSEILHRMQSEKRHNRKCCPPAFYQRSLRKGESLY